MIGLLSGLLAILLILAGIWKRKYTYGKALIVFGVSLIVIPGIFFYYHFVYRCLGDWQSYPGEILEEWEACESDEDCTFESLKCCPLCDQGIPINIEGETRIKDWKEANCGECCLRASCTPEAFNKVPICENEKCTFRVKSI